MSEENSSGTNEENTGTTLDGGRIALQALQCQSYANRLRRNLASLRCSQPSLHYDMPKQMLLLELEHTSRTLSDTISELNRVEEWLK